jgi:hypothetical protein
MPPPADEVARAHHRPPLLSCGLVAGRATAGGLPSELPAPVDSSWGQLLQGPGLRGRGSWSPLR